MSSPHRYTAELTTLEAQGITLSTNARRVMLIVLVACVIGLLGQLLLSGSLDSPAIRLLTNSVVTVVMTLVGARYVPIWVVWRRVDAGHSEPPRESDAD